MAEIIHSTAGSLDARRGTQQPGFDVPFALPIGAISSENVSGGMVIGIPRDQLKLNSFSLLRNARTRDDWVGRRPGTEEYGGEKPNSNPVLKLLTYITSDEHVYLVRITRTGIHIQGNEAWIAITSAFDATDQLTNHRLSIAQLFGFLVIANGGVMTYLDVDNTLHQAIPDAPRAKYIASFAERIVAANMIDEVGGIGTSKIKWSKNADFLNWDDISAGEENLVQSPSDFSDEIVGLFGLEQELVILRRRSIWHATRQPFAQAPFRFTPVISGFGCDLPYTAVAGEGVIFYADQRTKGVYAYVPGSRPERISENIDTPALFADLQNLNFAEATYDPYNREYHLGLSIGEGKTWITKVWIFSIQNGSWSYDDGPEVSTIGVVSTPGTFVSIDDLVGDIDSLSGTIDSLGGVTPIITPVLFKGTATGEVLKQSFDVDNDWDEEAFEFEAISQNIGDVVKRRTMMDLTLKVNVEDEFESSYTLDEKNEEGVWRNTQTGTIEDSGTLRIPKTSITGRDLYWRLRATTGFPKLVGWWARMQEKGLHR